MELLCLQRSTANLALLFFDLSRIGGLLILMDILRVKCGGARR
jgi:hypothetical protein